MKGIGDAIKVLIPVIEEEAFSIQPGNKEWVSVIECIGVNGYVPPAFIIFQGQRLQQSWVNNRMDKRTVLHVSENGWTDRTIALAWLKHFDQYTSSQTKGKYRLLILDGHSSHVSLPFIEYCEEHNIIPLSAASFNPYSPALGCRHLLSSCQSLQESNPAKQHLWH